MLFKYSSENYILVALYQHLSLESVSNVAALHCSFWYLEAEPTGFNKPGWKWRYINDAVVALNSSF